MFKSILLCTHGSEGAQKAEKLLFEKLLPASPNLSVTILTVIDKDWAGMSQDDWLNTSKARTMFKDYVEEQLTEEIEADWSRIKKTHPKASDCTFLKVVGEIEETFIEVAGKLEIEAILIGPRQKKKSRLFSVKMAPGLAHTLDQQKLQSALDRPLIIAPEKL